MENKELGRKTTSLVKKLERNLGNGLEQRNKSTGIEEISNCKWRCTQQYSLHWLLMQIFWPVFVLNGVIRLVEFVILQSLIPLIQLLLLENFSLDPTDPDRLTTIEIIIYTSYFILIIFIALLIKHISTVSSHDLGSVIASSLRILIYRKILKLDKQTVDVVHDDLITLSTHHLDDFNTFLMALHVLWIVPIQIITVCIIIYKIFGVAAVLPVLYSLFATAIIGFIFHMIIKCCRGKIVDRRAERMSLMKDITEGIKTIKMCAWEGVFEELLLTARSAEVKASKSALHVISIISAIRSSWTNFMIAFSIYIYSKFDNEINPEFLFTIAMYSIILKNSLIVILPNTIVQVLKNCRTMKKVEDIMRLEEIEGIGANSVEQDEQFSSLKFEKLFTKELHDVSMQIDVGKLCVIVGNEESAKSSIINVILGEVPIISGKFCFNNGNNTAAGRPTISLVSLKPWLINGTIRDNILLFERYDPERYKEVLSLCALAEDLEALAKGDQTTISSNETHFPQQLKLKINLARAIYKKSQLYLFDDILNEFTPGTRTFIYNECICKYLEGKTRIVISQPMQLFRTADYIVYMNSGAIEAGGKYNELIDTNGRFSMTIHSHECNGNEELDSLSLDCALLSQHSNSAISIASNENDRKQEESRKSLFCQLKDHVLRSKTLFSLFAVLLGLIISQIALSGMDVFLCAWMNRERPMKNIQQSPLERLDNRYFRFFNNTLFLYYDLVNDDGLFSPDHAINFYLSLLIGSFSLILVSNYLFIRFIVLINQSIHDSAFTSILHTSMESCKNSWKESIVETFDKDLFKIDTQLPYNFLEAARKLFLGVAIMGIMVLVETWLIVPAVIVVIVIVFILVNYMRYDRLHITSKKCKYSMVTRMRGTIDGLITIRSGGKHRIALLANAFHKLEQEYSLAEIAIASKYLRFKFWMKLTMTIFISSVCYVISTVPEDILVGTLGLVSIGVITLITIFDFDIDEIRCSTTSRSLSELLSYENSPIEESRGHSPPASWPTRGRITMQDVTAKYPGVENFALKDFNAVIEHGWRVGMVDESGQSSHALIDILFNLNPNIYTGQIQIAGKTIKSVALSDLRSRLSIIPQNPFFFNGTVRFNMDPLSEKSDETLSRMLTNIGLNDINLDTQIVNNGKNLSVGQRQLICLAVACLKKNRVVIVHESRDTDQFARSIMKKVLKTKFKTQTIIILAHYLSSIIDSDRVLLLKNGKLVEFGCPYELLCDKPDGYFANLVNITGKTNANYLFRCAKIACRQNANQYSLDLASNTPTSMVQ